MSRDARSVAQTRARFTGPPAFPAGATAIRGQRFFTNHESRNTAFFSVVRDGRRHRKPPSGPLPPPASRCFPVHHCSLLFAIVQQKILFCASALAPPGRCFPARCGAAWRGYGAAWAPAVPRTGNRACWVFTSHETRNMGFPCFSGDSRKSNPKPGQQVFHESRDTSHEARLLRFPTHDFPRFPGISRHFPAFPGPPTPWERVREPFSRCFPARCGAAWGGYGAAWAAAVPRAGNTACGVFTSRETRNMGFPCSSGGSRESNPKPGQRVFHESRITRHESRPLCFFPTISRHFPLLFGSPLPLEPVSARRQPRLPSSSGLLPPRQT